MLKRRTASSTDLEKWTQDEILAMFGATHLFESTIKSLKPHDSRHNERQREREAKALERKAKRKQHPKR